MEIYKTSEMVEEMKPVWAQFIEDLGYTNEQGQKFTEGYASRLAKLPLFRKMQALDERYDPCMTAGFEAAGIDEDEAHQRYQNLENKLEE